MAQLPNNSLHAIVTDPPYGVKEYEAEQIDKRSTGNGGVWRIPPSFDGNVRAPLPRFTALNVKERKAVKDFFTHWTHLAVNALRPGGHVFIATNAFLSQMVFASLIQGGLEFRGEVIRLVQTLRGGDRPKNAEEEFPGVCSMPRGCYEPWGLFRKPMPDRSRGIANGRWDSRRSIYGLGLDHCRGPGGWSASSRGGTPHGVFRACAESDTQAGRDQTGRLPDKSDAGSGGSFPVIVPARLLTGR
ncbi:MAG TPA: hypothetical protein VFC78_07305 [Tepidisphaeraceae bacterium]|nr:hypothetical protein [Tepidisphaeraceae bacterium]